ncbi:polysaccharide deacetylase family protein [Roseomonas marmotae]|uniref:Chitooligosaccharide deacetylase n=1 Tax=Roseomonas marmotae TaxID=2768161 RepID=A0ABS3K998_9PROT|nr:polysaccharide deacetylase family protein [Roseomonas marmotae]MBO1073505.1 polysaccharide deacetylase family protein [Roseomonas marmotae]QTI80306.1 polysaccharide deacetylase family protein [Roseomonas marmotae]
MTTAPRVTLSFDNGPEPEVTPGVLEALRARGLRATFFVLGHKLAAHRALAERAHAEGHWIGNHTWSHAGPLGHASDAVAETEIARTQEEIGALSHPDRLFRPQGGGGALGRHLLSHAALDLLVRGHFTCVLWNAVPGDFRDPEGWVDRALDLCQGPEPVTLVLHDLPNGAMRHLDRFLGTLADRGARFTQDFPAACVPLRRGQPSGRVADYVTPHRGAAA